MNWKPILITLAIYISGIAAVFLTEKFYRPRAANDITGPPFLVMALVGLVFAVFFIVTLVNAFKQGGAYWIAAILQLVFILFLVYKQMV